MNPILIALAIAPGLLVSFYIFNRDRHEPEPRKYLIFSFLFGVISTAPAMYLEQLGAGLGFEESSNLMTTFIFAFIVVALSEELAKFAFLVGYIYPKDEFNEPMDGIVYATMIGMGFATLENLLYASYGWETTLVRAFTAVPAHGAFAVIMGYFVGLAKFSDQNRWKYLLQGLFYAVLMHGAYDFFIFQKNYPALAGLTLVTLVLGILFGKRMIRIHQEISPFNPNRKTQEEILNQEPPLSDIDLIPDKKEDENDDDGRHFSVI